MPGAALLAVVGDLVEDVVVWLDGPIERGTDTAGRVFRSLGGSAANVASAAQVPARFLGCVGDDPLGRELVAQLQGRGVDVHVQRRGRTGTVVVLVEPGGERTMAPDRAAAADLAPLPTAALDDVAILHVPAYGLVGGRTARTVRELLGTAAARGVAVSMDASSVAVLRQLGTDDYRALVERVRPRLLFANVDEARLLDLLRRPPAGVTVLVKDGARATTLLTGDGTTSQVPVPTVAGVRDSTGAGDAFAAGYLSAVLRDEPPLRCVAAGHALAAQVLLRPGAGTRTGGAP